MDENSAICYRIYDVGQSGEESSLFYCNPRPPMNEPTPSSSSEPFHAFLNLEEVVGYLQKDYSVYSKKWRLQFAVYRCRLEENLYWGYWEETNMITVTGKKLTVLEKVNHEVEEIIEDVDYVPFKMYRNKDTSPLVEA
jgi:hypothetical protein